MASLEVCVSVVVCVCVLCVVCVCVRERDTERERESVCVTVHELCFHLCCHSLEVPFFLLKYFCPYNECTFGDEFLSHLKSHQRCSAAFCRPVKFFHTD